MPKKKKSEVPKEPPDFSRKPLAYKTIKTSLKSILKDPQTHQPLFNSIILRCNKIVTEAYQLIRLFCLDKYHRREPCPTLDERFILYCLKATGVAQKRKPSKDEALRNEINSFYESELKPLLAHEEKHDLTNMSNLLVYVSVQMHTAIHNNLKVHFLTRLFRFINKTAPAFETGLSKEEALRERKALKDALVSNDVTLLPIRYAGWMAQHRPHILPGEWEKTLAYDIKANPERYLFCSFYMNEILERDGHKLFQPLSLRNEIIPHYVTFDTTVLIALFGGQGKSKLLKNIEENKDLVWSSIFNLEKKIFHQKHYDFHFLLHTDGIGASLTFVHKSYKDKSVPKSSFSSEGEYHFHYVEELHDFQLENLKSKNIVGADPGKYNLLYMADGEGKKLRYTAFQRRTETLTKRNSRILLQEKKRNGIIERESSLSDKNSKTVDYERFKSYVREKNLLNDELSSFYERDLFRKMKWRHFTYTQRSEDRFLNRIGEIFGKDAVIAYGNWNRSSQMGGFVPTKGIGLRKLISRKFLTLSVDEFRTSKLCCHCHDELSCLQIKKNDDANKKIFRCLVCKECGGSESKNTIFVTRDLNSALNIRKMVLHWIRERIRPSEFSRSRSENS